MSNLREINEKSGENFATRLLQAGYDVDKAFTPFQCLFGALGNLLSLALFSLNRKYRRQSSSYYLSALAISDTGFLISLLVVWLESVYGGVITSPFLCRLVMYLGQVTCFISVYVMVGFSVERYIAVHNPLSRQQICTKSRTKKGLVCVTCVALLLFSYAWFIAQLIEIRPRTYRKNSMQTKNTTINLFLEYASSTSANNLENSTFDVNADMENFYWVEEAVHPSPGNGSNTVKENFNKPSSASFLSQLSPCLDSSNQTTNTAEVNTSKPKSFRYFYCSVPRKYRRISQIANYFDTVVTLIIPFLLISFCNIKIVLALQKLQKDRQQFQSCSTTLQISNKVNTTLEITPNQSTNQTVSRLCSRSNEKFALHSDVSSQSRLSQRDNLHTVQTTTYLGVNPSNQCAAESRTTKRLVLVSTVFLLLNLPLHVIRCAQFVQSLTGTNEEKDLFAALQPWANLLFNTNFAINFVLYCVIGKNFRQSVKCTVLSIISKVTGRQPAHLHRPTPLPNQQKTVLMVKYNIRVGGTIGGSLKLVKTDLNPETYLKQGLPRTNICNTI